MIIGRVYADQGKLIIAKPFLKQAIAHDKENSWKTAWALYYLGKIAFQSDNLKLAQEYFRKSRDLNATRNVSRKSQEILKLTGLSHFYQAWQLVETQNIRFYFQPSSKVSDFNHYAEIRQSALNNINQFFKVQLPKKIDFIVWNANEDAQAIGFKQLGFAKPEYSVIHSRYNQTLGHELTHVIVSFLNESRIVTRFINEGLAVAFDQSNQDTLSLAKQFKSSYTKKISIEKAWKNNNVYPEWAYYQLSGELIKRLLEVAGRDKLIKLAIDNSFANAEQIYGETLLDVINKLQQELN